MKIYKSRVAGSYQCKNVELLVFDTKRLKRILHIPAALLLIMICFPIHKVTAGTDRTDCSKTLFRFRE